MVANDGDDAVPGPLSRALADLSVENVYVYVADAVRWDFAPDSVLDRGHAVKTVASGIHSPTSIASLLSGTYLPQHHVAGFVDGLPREVPNLLAAGSVETAFVNSINHVRFDPDDPSLIADTLGVDERHPDVLSETESPFLVVERGPGGHAPYGGFDGDGWEYFEARSDASRDRFASEYRDAVAEDARWFRSRLDELEDRGLLEDTLVVYTSDHGELLGEAGMLAHSPPIHPAHVFVPTVFVHPRLPRAQTTDRVFRHVDLVPTVASLLDLDLAASVAPAGRDLTAERLAARGASFHAATRETPLGELHGGFDSAWTPNGGHVFPRAGRLQRLLVGLHGLVRVPWRGYARRNANDYLTFHLRDDRTHGAPELSVTDARQYLRRVRERETARREEASEVAEESLRQLGYLE